MNIDPNDPRLTAYVLGELDQKERAGIEAQLEKSEELRQAVSEIRETTELLTREFQGEPSAALSDDQRRAIESAAAKGNGTNTAVHIGRSTWRRLRIPMGLAASVLIILGALRFVPHLSRSRENSPLGTIAGRYAAPADALRSTMPNFSYSVAQVASNDTNAESRVPSTSNQGDPSLGSGALGCYPDPGLVVLDTRPLDASKLDQLTFTFTGVQQFGNPAERINSNTVNLELSSLGYIGDDSPIRHPLPAFNLSVTLDASNTKPGVSFYGFAPAGMVVDASFNAESYDRIVENPFLLVVQNPLSTFSIDVDTASYGNVRRFLNQGRLPPPGAVRIEEMVNYFEYDYPPPTGDAPFSVNVEVADCPWMPGHRLARIGLKGYEVDVDERPAANLVFLLDVSGSMNSPDKLPLLKQALRMLTAELADDDRVAIAVYAGASGLILPSTWCEDQQAILGALDRLKAGGSTNGGAGIQLAYDIASDNFIEGGINRVILATDGDFNVGITNQGDLIELIEEKAKSGVFLSVLGFGTGNLKDSTMEKLADKGNGNYSYIDTLNEARKVLVEQMGGTLVTIAKDVKIQIEFNPAEVGAYRLIGYENRMLRKEDFNDDTIDAGEIGAGHTVTAFYEIVPAGEEDELPTVDPLKYQTPPETDTTHESGELMTVKLRYKEPDGDSSKLLEVAVTDAGLSLADVSEDFIFGAAVASFGMLLRGSEHCGEFTYGAALEMADAALGEDPHGYRQEFVDLVQQAIELQPSP